jgi:hypothetical protein
VIHRDDGVSALDLRGKGSYEIHIGGDDKAHV